MRCSAMLSCYIAIDEWGIVLSSNSGSAAVNGFVVELSLSSFLPGPPLELDGWWYL
jgi:hypothetical protein